ncbi:hypothetical protein [Streptomyces noursei]|uniref:hypothetical protein n=1 Tax=Streptomyces noursei TaxID=1971 RepID=UPI00381499E9
MLHNLPHRHEDSPMLGAPPGQAGPFGRFGADEEPDDIDPDTEITPVPAAQAQRR